MLALTCRCALLGGATLALPRAASAQAAWPNRPITILMGFAAGGATDAPTRLIAARMQERLGVPVVIENRPGGNQMIAIQRLLAAPPDGYTLYAGTGSSLGQNAALRPSLGLDPRRDYTPVARYAVAGGLLVVRADLPVGSLAELVAYARDRPGQLTYGSAGIGTANHLSTEMLAAATGTRFEHVAYRSDAQVGLEVSEGRIDFALNSMIVGRPLVEAGKLRALAVTSVEKLPFAPGIPTLREAGVPGLEGLDPFTYYGLVGPARMPSELVSRLNVLVNEATASPEIAARFRDTMWLEPIVESPAQFGAYIAAQYAKWAELGQRITISWD